LTHQDDHLTIPDSLFVVRSIHYLQNVESDVLIIYRHDAKTNMAAMQAWYKFEKKFCIFVRVFESNNYKIIRASKISCRNIDIFANKYFK